LDEADDRRQAMAEMGIEVEPGRGTSLQRRYEAACWRKMVWAENRLLALRAEANEKPAPSKVPPPSAYAGLVTRMPEPLQYAPGLDPANAPFTPAVPVSPPAPVAPKPEAMPKPTESSAPTPKATGSLAVSDETLARAAASIARLPEECRQTQVDLLSEAGVPAAKLEKPEQSPRAIRLSDAVQVASPPRNRRERRAAERELRRGG
jgi:hypothetical protein